MIFTNLRHPKYEMLAKEQERELIKEYRETESDHAITALINAHARLINSMARKKFGYEVSTEDLIQEGVIGFINAVRKYEVTSETRLCTYVTYYINNAMYEYIFNHGSRLRFNLNHDTKKIFFNHNRYRNEHGNLTTGAIKRMSDDLNVSEHAIRSMDIHNSALFMTEELESHDQIEIADWRYEPSTLLENYQQMFQNCAIMSSVDELDERTSDIIKRRYLSDDCATLSDLGSFYNVSTERIRQIEVSGLKKIRNQFKEYSYEMG